MGPSHTVEVRVNALGSLNRCVSSGVAQGAVERELRGTRYWFVNTNKANLPPEAGDGTAIYTLSRSVVATYGPREYGEKFRDMHLEDYVFSYVSGVGIRALGHISGVWDGRPAGPNEESVLPEAHRLMSTISLCAGTTFSLRRRHSRPKSSEQ